MKSMRWKLAAGSVLLGLCSLAAVAQAPDQPGDQPGPPPQGDRMANPDRELHMLTKRLSLTADQQTGVKAVLEQQANEMKALHAKASSDPDGAPEARQALMTQMMQIHNESNSKIAALLDDNQKKLFAEIIARRKAEMEHRQQDGDNPPPPPPDGGGPPPGGDR